jgi:hypothetical protein
MEISNIREIVFLAFATYWKYEPISFIIYIRPSIIPRIYMNVVTEEQQGVLL